VLILSCFNLGSEEKSSGKSGAGGGSQRPRVFERMGGGDCSGARFLTLRKRGSRQPRSCGRGKPLYDAIEGYNSFEVFGLSGERIWRRRDFTAGDVEMPRLASNQMGG